MRADDDEADRGPQYQAAPFDGSATGRPAKAPIHVPRDAGPSRGPLPDAGASRLARMLRAQAQHHQGRR